MIPKALNWLLGDSWRTSAAGLAAAALLAAQTVPDILTGHATREQWVMFGVALVSGVLGRAAADDKPHKPDSFALQVDAASVLDSVAKARQALAQARQIANLPQDHKEH